MSVFRRCEIKPPLEQLLHCNQGNLEIAPLLSSVGKNFGAEWCVADPVAQRRTVPWQSRGTRARSSLRPRCIAPIAGHPCGFWPSRHRLRLPPLMKSFIAAKCAALRSSTSRFSRQQPKADAPHCRRYSSALQRPRIYLVTSAALDDLAAGSSERRHVRPQTVRNCKIIMDITAVPHDVRPAGALLFGSTGMASFGRRRSVEEHQCQHNKTAISGHFRMP